MVRDPAWHVAARTPRRPSDLVRGGRLYAGASTLHSSGDRCCATVSPPEHSAAAQKPNRRLQNKPRRLSICIESPLRTPRLHFTQMVHAAVSNKLPSLSAATGKAYAPTQVSAPSGRSHRSIQLSTRTSWLGWVALGRHERAKLLLPRGVMLLVNVLVVLLAAAH